MIYCAFECSVDTDKVEEVLSILKDAMIDGITMKEIDGKQHITFLSSIDLSHSLKDFGKVVYVSDGGVYSIWEGGENIDWGCLDIDYEKNSKDGYSKEYEAFRQHFKMFDVNRWIKDWGCSFEDWYHEVEGAPEGEDD